MAKTIDAGDGGHGRICTTPRMGPVVCPMCQAAPPKGDKKSLVLALEAHILTTHPAKTLLHPACVARQPEDQPARWMLDWDSVRHAPVGGRLYFCITCGIYAPDVTIVTRGA
jgi:hypothetical protein